MRMRHGVSSLLAALLVLGAAAAAHAQKLEEPRSRQGYYVAGGMHAALSFSNDEGEELGPWGGYGTTIRLGQMITNRLGLGMQIDVSGASGDGRTSSLMGFGVSGQAEIARNLAVHLGIGLGVVSVNDPDVDETSGGYGAAYSLALTYDWFLGNRRTGGWAITPGIRLRAVPNETVDGYAALAGLEISWWSGLPKHQLQLPDSEAY
jgi:opacity protein-like surface antigen